MNIKTLFNVKGNIDARKLKFLSEEDLIQIKKETCFLRFNPTLSQRIKIIKLNVKEHQICSCGKYLPYSPNKNKAFKNYCCMSCAKKFNYNKDITKKFKIKLETNQQILKEELNNAEIKKLEETKIFFKENIEFFKKGGSKSLPILKENLNYLRSLFFYTSNHKTLNARIYELLYGKEYCTFCGESTTFISLEKGYRKYCSEHANLAANKQKGLNNVQEAIKKIQTFDSFSDYEIIKIPEKLNDLFIIKHKICENNFKLRLNNGKLNDYQLHCNICQNPTISAPELQICKWLKDKNINFIHQYSINNTSLDVYLPDFNVAIEYHGLMYHSYGKHESLKFNNYLDENPSKHLKKLETCNENNIFLFQIFENEWKSKIQKDIWLSTISSKLGLNEKIFARKCTIKTLTNKESFNFYHENHLQGAIKCSINLGLFYNEELVAAIGLGKPRMRNISWEIYRYCNKKYITVVGGFSKLLSSFQKQYNGQILSYANRRWSTGNLYEKTNFSFIGNSLPGYYYFNSSKILLSRWNFQKHKLKDILEDFNPELSERMNMYNNGYRRIWDCGNKIYVYENKREE